MCLYFCVCTAGHFMLLLYFVISVNCYCCLCDDVACDMWTDASQQLSKAEDHGGALSPVNSVSFQAVPLQ